MGFWQKAIEFAVPVVWDYFSGGDDDTAAAKAAEDKRNLVTKPIAGKLEEREKLKPWTSESKMKAFANASAGMAQPVGATPALRSASPSELSSRYWAAIYSDAKRRSEIR